MNKLMKRTAGFSLLELMVVVAIIGVLAAVAVPRYNIFRARARQAEPKSNLGVIFTLQEAFKIDKERYYDGTTTPWGGTPMNTLATAEGYAFSAVAGTPGSCSSGGHTTSSACTGAGGTWTPPTAGSTTAASQCRSNKLGFRLANCSAARYGYSIVAAGENEFLAYAYAPSDEPKRIFPGCSGATRENATSLPSGSQSGKTQCVSTVAGAAVTALGGAGGDAFCLDHARTVDNFVDIVGSVDCTN